MQTVDNPAWEVIILAGGDDETYEAASQATFGFNRSVARAIQLTSPYSLDLECGMDLLITVLWIASLAHIGSSWLLAIRRGQQARRSAAFQASQVPGAQPPVSIIVPAWNECGTIEGCIAALKRIVYPQWEAIILAGGEDGTHEATLAATSGDIRFRVLRRGPEPKNVALTRGIDAAQHDILVLLDADSIVAPDWLTMLVAPLETGNAASYGFYLPMKWTWISTEEFMQQIQYHNKGFGAFPGCSSEAIRREALNKIGPLTASAYSWEDWDIFTRLADANEKIVPVSQARLLSERPVSFPEFWANNLRAFRTHLAGLWYHRAIAIRHPFWAIYELFFLAYGSVLTMALIGGLVAVAARPALFGPVTGWAALLVFWIAGRRAALAGEVAAYTGECKWLAWAWAPIVLLLIRIPAALFAVLTVRLQPRLDYKGARMQKVTRNLDTGR